MKCAASVLGMQLCLWGKHHLRSMASWSPEATAELITVWSQENVQNELDGVSRNRTIFERIAKELCEKGYDKSWQQCRTKIKNLTQKYRKVRISRRPNRRWTSYIFCRPKTQTV